MQTYALSLTIALCLMLAACTAPSSTVLTDTASDAERINGTWQIIALWDSGRAAPAEAIADFQMTFTADAVVYDLDGVVIEATYRLHPDSNPKGIDIQPEGRGVWRGIYALSGDTLKIVVPDGIEPEEGVRSTAFESVDGSVNDWYAMLTRR